MQDTIYLVVDMTGVKRMTKNTPQLYKGEIAIKLEVTLKPQAFREPVITKSVVVEDWREGIDIADVEFKETVITEEEAALIRQQRLQRMSEILKAQGYEVTKLEETA